MLSVIVAVLILVVIAFVLSAFYECKISKAIVPAMLSIIVIMYFFALTGTLSVGKYLLAIFPTLALCYVLVKKKEKLKNFCDSDFLIWLLFFGIVVFVNYNRLYSVNDEFSHWGTAVKQMFFTRRLYTLPSSIVFFKEYPPASSLLELFFCMYQPQFAEGITYIGYYSLLFSILFSAICSNDKELTFFARVLLSLFSLFFISMWGGGSYYGTLMSDQMLAYVTAYIIFLYFAEKDTGFKKITMLEALFVLCLIKPTATAFIAYVLLAIIFDLIVTKDLRKKNLSFFILLLADGFVSTVSWRLHLLAMGVPPRNYTFSVDETIIFFKNLLSGNLAENERTVVHDIVYRFFVPIPEAFPMGISPLCWMLVALLLICSLGGKNKKRYMTLFTVSFVFLALFCAGTIIRYAVISHGSEGASAYYRYIPSAVAATVIPVVMLSVQILNEKSAARMVFLGITTMAIVAPARMKDIIVPWQRVEAERTYRAEFEDEFVYEGVNDGEKVFLIFQHEKHPISGSHQAGMIYHYNLVPRNVAFDFEPFWDASETVKESDYILTRIMESGADYLYICKVADDNIGYFSDVFGCEIGNNTYYKIEYEAGAFKLAGCPN